MDNFISPPTKNLMHLLKDNDISVEPTAKETFEPDSAIFDPQDKEQALKQVTEWLDQINAREEDSIKRIHTRYCIPRALKLNIAADVSRYYPNKAQNPHYYEYWFKWNTPNAYMLMTRHVFIKDNKPVLEITFNRDLIREGE